jgi:hypothetical protein
LSCPNASLKAFCFKARHDDGTTKFALGKDAELTIQEPFVAQKEQSLVSPDALASTGSENNRN